MVGPLGAGQGPDDVADGVGGGSLGRPGDAGRTGVAVSTGRSEAVVTGSSEAVAGAEVGDTLADGVPGSETEADG